MTAKAKKVLDQFTAQEQTLVQACASEVWQYISGDIMQALAEERKRSIPRAHVLELVCDASRLEEQIRKRARREGANYDELIKRVDALGIEVYELVKPAFPYSRYE